MSPGARRAASSSAARPPTESIAPASVRPVRSRRRAAVAASSLPLSARLPIVESPKSDGSSQVKLTTSSGCRSRCPLASRQRATSRPASTPAMPSNRPPASTVSRCEPTMRAGVESVPARRPIWFPAGVDRRHEPRLGHPAGQPLARRTVLVREGPARVRAIRPREAPRAPGDRRRAARPTAGATGPRARRSSGQDRRRRERGDPGQRPPGRAVPVLQHEGPPAVRRRGEARVERHAPRNGRPCCAAVTSPPGPSKSGPTVPQVGQT